MRLSQLRVFLAVAELGGIRAAARMLEVSPPAVTKGIRQLEQELQVRLLERTQHGVVASPAGRALAVRARVMLSEMRKADEDMERFAGASIGSVAFGVGPTGMQLIVPEAVALFRQQYPDASVRIVEGRHPALLPLVRDATLDFAVGLKPAGKLDSGLGFRPLFRHYEAIVARKGHSLAGARSLAQLVRAKWVSTLPRSADDILNAIFLAADLPLPPPAIECESVPGVVALLTKTDMVAMMPRRILELPFARDVLGEIHVAEPLPSVAHGIFTRVDAPLTPAATAMAKVVTAVGKQLARRE
jgi:DNA-binding transcriptional LysR family regulator